MKSRSSILQVLSISENKAPFLLSLASVAYFAFYSPLAAAVLGAVAGFGFILYYGALAILPLCNRFTKRVLNIEISLYHVITAVIALSVVLGWLHLSDASAIEGFLEVLAIGYIAMAANALSHHLSVKERRVKFSLYWVLGAIAVGMFFFQWQQPSHALFLTGLETEINNLTFIANSIPTAAIETIFDVFRVVLALFGIGGGFAAWNQMQQGQSATPIVMMVAGIFAVVLGIDLVVFIMF